MYIHQYNLSSFARVPLSREFRFHISCLVVLVVCFSRCSDGFRLSPTLGLASPLGPPFNRLLDTKEFRDDNLQIRGRHAERSYGPYDEFSTVEAEAAEAGLGIHSRRQMSATRSSRDRHSYIQVSAVSNNNKSIGPPAVEVEGLAAFKAAISDPSNALRTWIGNGSNTCSEWVGVFCSPQFPHNVVTLDLSSLQLEGSLNSVLPTLAHLTSLQTLDLSENLFSGSIEGEILSNFTHLSYFNVSDNVITGGIPSQIGALVRLQILDLSKNNMTGSIPESIGNCSSLRFIDVATNTLGGDIPASFGKLAGIEHIKLAGNTLTGTIPAALGNCSSLQYLDLNINVRLEGALPEELSMLKNLQLLYLVDVYISGVFPPWIANLTSLSQFAAGFNNLQGEIPDSIGQLEFLSEFSLYTAPMTGVIPLSLFNLTSLIALEIVTTNISGKIPPEIGTLPNFFWLNLEDSQFTGGIPSSLANCSALSTLEIGYNGLMDPEPIPPWVVSLTGLNTLYLVGINLQGELPNSIGQLSNLQTLDLGHNNLSGVIPTGLQNCTFLYYVDVSNNSFTGEIPPELGVLTSTVTFLADYNGFLGPFPEMIFNWTLLEQTDLDNNNLHGLIDSRGRFGQLQQLSYFAAYSNDLEGPIPETIGNCTSLQFFDVAWNRLSGLIPASMGNLTNLALLALASNSFQGTIPVNLLTSNLQLSILDLSVSELEGSIPWEIGQLVQLSQLYLSNSKFSGIVPSSLGNCTQMGILDLSNNQFVGDIPAAVILSMSTTLEGLNLSYNRFSGSWPAEFSKLINVQVINISSNNISGPLPLGLGKCVNLNILDISLNNFSGQIPEDLGSLKNLQVFNASFNDFTGPIPQSGIFNSNLIDGSSFLGNPGLCGPAATIGPNHSQCAPVPLNVSTPGSTHDRHCKGFNCKQIWIPVLVGGVLLLLSGVGLLAAIQSGWIFHKDDRSRKQVDMLQFDAHIRLTKRDVLEAMDDIQGANVIGVGARSVVYKGILPSGQMFALKKLLLDKESGSHGVDNNDLLNEAKILAKLRHKNIVKCLGFYSDMDHKALVLEYVSGGSLHRHLHEVEPSELTWQKRLNVAMGVAEGMKYLHHDFPEALIHRDLKPSNIFLDADFEPKIGDFGISKFVGTEREGEAPASTFCGTIGYTPPEYASQLWVSTKGDVYSYGMVVIELLTRKQPCSANAQLEDEGRDLRSWVLDCFHEKPLELLEPSLIIQCHSDGVAKEQMMLLLRVSLFCTRADPESRPSMINVVAMLISIMNLGKEPVMKRSAEELANDIWVSQDPAIEGSEFSSSSNS